MPEGNKIWVLGDGVGPNRPATNFPGISLDSNRFDCLVEKSGLDIEPRPESPVGHRGFFCALQNRGLARRICEGYIIKGTKRTWFWWRFRGWGALLEHYLNGALTVPESVDEGCVQGIRLQGLSLPFRMLG